MKNVSSAFREELKKDNRNYIKSADITLKSGTVLKVDNSDLWQNGMKLDTATSNPNSFDLGAIITGQLTLTLNNIDEKFSDYDFTDCTATNVKVGLKLPDGTTESLSYGKFYLNEAKYNGSIITLTFYDSIYKFDRPYSKSSLSYPATLRQIVQDACSVCGVTLGTVTFDQDDFVVQERPDDSSITFRQVLQWVGQIACYYFYADSQGRLSMKWYDLSAFEDADNIFLKDSDGNFVLDAQEDKIFTFVENGTIYPGTTMPHHNIASFVSLNTGLDDVVITGIKVIQEVDGESGGKEEISYQSGNDGYVLAVSKNKLIQGDSGNTIASLLGTKIIGMRFRTFSASGLSDPTIEAGDPVVLIDRKGNSYQSYITNNVFQPGAYQSTSLGAETPARKSATRYSQITQVYVDYRKEIEKERTDREEALEELGEQIKGSSGLFTTIETQADGSKKYFMHNKPVLSESDIIWSMTAEAWGVSTDGGKTYNAGMTVDGDTIVRILTAVGINADWIKTGALTIEKNGQVMFKADVDTGQVDIVANSFSLSDGTTLSSILKDSKEYTDDKISDIDPSKNLTQSEIFNILTNNGQTQGIYLSGGKIYINASYISSGNLTANRIKGGTLTLGGSGNTNGILKILNSRGAQIGLWNNSGISASNAEVDGYFSASDGTRKISISGGEISLYYKNKQCAAINPSRYNSDNNQLGLDIQSIGKYLTLTLGDIIHLTIGQVVYDGDGLTYTNTWYGANLFRGRIKLINSFSCTGTKSRVVKTKNYGNRLQYCYEMASPYFGDIGTSITDEFGESYISIDDIFSETASCNVEYQVFLQKEGMGDIWVEKKELTYFLVKGTPNLKFSWEIKVKQKDFEYERLDSEAFIEEDEENSVEKILTDEIEKYSENQEDLLWSIN